MKTPQGFCVPREMLKVAPSMEEAYRLRPATPPRCADNELLREWHRAVRGWETEILFLALARKRAGLHDHLDERIAPRGLARLPARDGAVLAAGEVVPAAASGRASERRGAAPGAAQGSHRRLAGALPFYLTLKELCRLARVSPAAIHRAVFLTRQGISRPGQRQYLPSGHRVEARFARADVIAWLAARGQTGFGSAGCAGTRPGRSAKPPRASAAAGG